MIYTIIRHFKNSSRNSLKILEQVFYENYEVIDETVNPLPKQALQIRSRNLRFPHTGRIETPHDPESDYHDKGSYQAKGYSINITETCDKDNPLNLITDAHVVSASVPDCHLMQPAIEATQELTSQPVETVHTDGGYYSKDNYYHCKEENIDFVLGKMPGQTSRYDIHSFDGEKLELIDIVINTIIPATKVQSKNSEAEPSWSFKNANNKSQTLKRHNVEVRLFR
ncbi:MAG: hypothetical protein FWG98_04880 [Candidatus Cloacimonetes bacterium]|nr:hypothetical protein [Candidatus Cloacimonadota bacterium]